MALPHNVTRLPTAPKLKVQQPSFRTYTALKRELPRLSVEWKSPWERQREREEAERKAGPKPLDGFERTPALILSMAMFGAASNEQRQGAHAMASYIEATCDSEAARAVVKLMDHLNGVRRNMETLVAKEEAK